MDIENAMEQYMAGEIETTEQPHTTRITEMLQRYVDKFGSVRLQILRLAGCTNDDLRRYLNTLRITLIRKGVQPQYLWQYDPSENTYALFLCHYDIQPECVLQVIHRLWHGLYPIQTINSIRVDQYNLADTAAWLAQAFSALQPSTMTPFYQHTFGYSRSL